MKIYINEQHQIKAIRWNDTGDDTLTEVEVEDDFLSGFCDIVIKSFCYHKWADEDGSERLSVYPYKDFELLMSIQAEHDAQETIKTDLQLALAEQYETNLLLQEETTNTQIALAEIFERKEV